MIQNLRDLCTADRALSGRCCCLRRQSQVMRLGPLTGPNSELRQLKTGRPEIDDGLARCYAQLPRRRTGGHLSERETVGAATGVVVAGEGPPMKFMLLT